MQFELTWDYRCPFARNATEHVSTALEAGSGWDVTFVPFSLGQIHVAEGEPDVWDRPASEGGLLSLEVGTVVRDQFPERFLDTHHALFRARHDEGRDLRDEAVLRDVLDAHGVDADAVFAELDSGRALERVRADHERAVREHDVWGVPTFIVPSADRAVFVRLMSRPDGDAEVAQETIQRVLDVIADFPELNELKQTNVAR